MEQGEVVGFLNVESVGKLESVAEGMTESITPWTLDISMSGLLPGLLDPRTSMFGSTFKVVTDAQVSSGRLPNHLPRSLLSNLYIVQLPHRYDVVTQKLGRASKVTGDR